MSELYTCVLCFDKVVRVGRESPPDKEEDGREAGEGQTDVRRLFIEG